MDQFTFELIEHKFRHLENILNEIKTQGANIMAQIDDLNAAIAALKAANAQLATDLAAGIADIQAQLAAAKAAGTPPDLTSQIADLTAVVTALQGEDTSAKTL